MFAVDRDLLAYEPRVFLEVAWAGQTALRQSGSVSGTTLTLAGGDLTAAGVGVGWVLTTPSVSLEVLEVLGATQATVSLPRATSGDAAIPPDSFSNETVRAVTFRPQIARVHERLMREAGVALAGESGEPGVGAVANAAQLRELEAFGALAMVYGAATAYAEGADGNRASYWRGRFSATRECTRVELDLDGDGAVDAARMFSARRLTRAW